MSHCPTCGAPLSDGGNARFCRMCGLAVPYATAAGPYATAGAGDPGVSGVPGGPGVSQGGAPQQGDDYESYFRPVDGAPSPHTLTQVMPAVPAQAGYAQPYPQQYQQQGYPGEGGGYPPQPGYDGGDYQEGGYAAYGEDYDDSQKSKRILGMVIGGVAVTVVIIGGLLLLGGGNKGQHNAAASGPSSSTATPVITSPPPQPTPSSVVPTVSFASISPTPSATATDGMLSLGSKGQQVRTIQSELRQLHFYDGRVNGDYGVTTAEAVILFQATHHIIADPAGTVGPTTAQAISDAAHHRDGG